jgi:hypothetical protein
MTRLTLSLAALLLALPASAAVRIDASDEAAYQRSLLAARQELPREQRAAFDAALVQIAHERAAFDLGPPREWPLDEKRLDGLTAEQVLALATRIATAPGYRGGERAGLPARFRRTLADTVATEGTARAPRIGGTVWEVVSTAANGAVQIDRIELVQDGRLRRLPGGGGGADTWQQLGVRVRLAFDAGHAVFLGRMVTVNEMDGDAANVFGDAGVRWKARRIELAAPLAVDAGSPTLADASVQLMAAYAPGSAAALRAAAARLSDGCRAPDPRTRAPIGPDYRKLAGLTAAALLAEVGEGCGSGTAPR